ncbi:hypothetical protein ACQ4PT_035219 [Festuca glaucescens]
MDSRASPVPTHCATAAEFRRLGLDPDDAEGLFRRAAASFVDILGTLGPVMAVVTDFLNNHLNDSASLFSRLFFPPNYDFPTPPASPAARLFALPPNDAVDRVSRLPDALLGDIVSRLPVKDAARTAALSRRWRGVWRSAPLVLVDADLFPATSSVSSVLATHPGPISCAHLTSSYTVEFHDLLPCWLQLLADKGIRDLVLVNRRWPLDSALPATFLGMATLTCLYLGLWKFPSTVGLPRKTCFPNLRELELCNVIMGSRDLDFILDRSPVLEMLSIHGNLVKFRLRLVSQSIRKVALTGSFVEEIFVVDAPCLDLLIHSEVWILGGSCSKIKIGHAPRLNYLGFLHPRNHVLEFSNTIIKARTRVSPSTMVPSVTFLAMHVRFGVHNDLKMMPSFLRCFPNVEDLHIWVKPPDTSFGIHLHHHHSMKTDRSAGKLNLKFWHESGTIECIQSHIKRLHFHDFRGGQSELAFLKFFFESALVLEEAVIHLDAGFTSLEEIDSKLEILGSMKRASKASLVVATGCSGPQGGYTRSFKRGSDFSVRDPFAHYSDAPVCTCKTPLEICILCLKIPSSSGSAIMIS